MITEDELEMFINDLIMERNDDDRTCEADFS